MHSLRLVRFTSLVVGLFLVGACAEPAQPAAAPAPASGHARASRPEAHSVRADPDGVNAPTGEGSAIAKLRDAQSRFTDDMHVECTVLTDLAFPHSKEEFDELGGWTFVLLSGFSHRAEELPFKRVYMRFRDQSVDLQPLLERASEVSAEDADVVETFGSHRFDGLYYIPVAMTQAPVEIVVDFAAARSDFVAQTFPMPNSELGLPEGVNLDQEPSTPQPKAIVAFVKREYPFMVPKE